MLILRTSDQFYFGTESLPNQLDTLSPDAVIDAYYAAISFSGGQEPDWQRLRGLFHPGAIFVPSGFGDLQTATALDIEGYFAFVRQRFQETGRFVRGFCETERSR